MTQNHFVSLCLFLLTFLTAGPLCRALSQAVSGGNWVLLKPNIGISAMHMQLLNNDRVVIFDQTGIGRSNISLPHGQCRVNPPRFKFDCSAHSVEYEVASNSIRPLKVLTDVWCSSGALMPNGCLSQTGGFNDGDRAVRNFCACDVCEWEEIKFGLTQRRWYATNQILPDRRQIIIGGRRQFNYEFYPKNVGATISYNLPFLLYTKDQEEMENNLYPFVFLNTDGNLFIFANNRAILFDYSNDVVVKQYPQIPDGNPRNYPSTGSAALLPLKLMQGKSFGGAEVLVCGGAPKGSYTSATNGTFVGALNTCGRLKITDPSPDWVMENMPMGRVMGDMLLLPNGNVLIINGGSTGTAGWELGRNPVLNPVVYRPKNPIGSRFELENPSSTPRMYHSAVVVLRDGRVLVGGSNPNRRYNFTGVLFPTELSLEAFSPSYLNPEYSNLRPKIISPISQTKIMYNQRIVVRFTITGTINQNLVLITMVAPSFNTHSFAQNQRLLVIGAGNVTRVGVSTYEMGVTTPGSGMLAPSGFYMLFVVHQEIPSLGIWVQIQ